MIPKLGPKKSVEFHDYKCITKSNDYKEIISSDLGNGESLAVALKLALGLSNPMLIH